MHHLDSRIRGLFSLSSLARIPVRWRKGSESESSEAVTHSFNHSLTCHLRYYSRVIIVRYSAESLMSTDFVEIWRSYQYVSKISLKLYYKCLKLKLFFGGTAGDAASLCVGSIN